MNKPALSGLFYGGELKVMLALTLNFYGLFIMRTYIFILLMSLLLASSAMPANAIECAHGMPKVAVKRMTKPVEYIRSFTSAGLTQMHTGAYRPDSPGILGLGGGAMEMQTTYPLK